MQNNSESYDVQNARLIYDGMTFNNVTIDPKPLKPENIVNMVGSKQETSWKVPPKEIGRTLKVKYQLKPYLCKRMKMRRKAMRYTTLTMQVIHHMRYIYTLLGLPFKLGSESIE